MIKPAGSEMPAVGDLNANFDILDEEVGTRPKTVNHTEPDEDGDIQIGSVAIAENLQSTQNQRSAGEFIRRTTGGSISMETGDAWLQVIRGRRVRTGYQEETLEMTVTPVSGSDIAAVMDEDAFRTAAGGDLTINFVYSTGWSADPAGYGITVSGTPVAGDQISVVYVAEVRGTIVQSDPQRFVATGWNLYEHAEGYAQVVRYSEEYGYRIVGSYTQVRWSETIDGSRQVITVGSGGLFQVPGDGYLWITGGSAADTAVYTTWSDRQTELPGEFETYTEYDIDLSAVMAAAFPFGLCQVGGYADEINISAGTATSWINRMAYSAANVQAAEESGRAWEADEDWIYIVRAAAETRSISVDGSFTGDEYGIEFVESDAPVYAETMYGANLRNKLERDVLTMRAQELSAAEKAQVMTNLGMSLEELCSSISGAVSAGLISNVNAKIATSATLRMWKCGHLLELSMMPRATAAMQDGDVIFTLAEGVRPVMAVYEPLLNEAYRVYQSKGISISASTGAVSLRLNADLPAGYFRVHMVFMIN